MSGKTVIPLLLIATIAFALLVADRYYRLSYLMESFQSSVGNACGVDLPPCQFPLRCMNGFCRPDAPPHLPPTSGLPVLP